MKGIIFLSTIYLVFAVPVEDNALQEFKNGNHKFTAGVYKEFLKQNPESFVVSPLSAEIILALVNEGAKGDTSDEIVTGLSLPNSKDKIQHALTSILPDFTRSEEDIKLLTANRIYVAKDVELADEFQSIARSTYKSGVEKIDFSRQSKATNTINKWVENNTNHKIKNFLQEKDVNKDTKTVLINALYFNGKWVSQFRPYETGKQVFHRTKSDTIRVRTMHLIEEFNYYEDTKLKAKFLELPFLGGNISMVIVLPDEIDGLADLEQNVEQLLVSPPYSRVLVDLDLPQVTTETTIDFVPILENLGIKKLFRGGDLSGISSTDRDLSVSKALQKVFIGVSEEGVEAAAATALLLEGAGPPIFQVTKPFKADHPFFYYIQVDGIVAFSGRYTG